MSSRHAEVDAVNNLSYNHNKKPKKINILIIRTNNKGDRFMLAKSCTPCINYMKKYLKLKNYKLHKGWYSNDEGTFTQFKL